MSRELTIGTATARPGTVQYGQWEAFDHPTGHTEFLPVVIAQGRAEGPCLWLTTGIHGPEHAGPVVLYQLLTPALLAGLHGTLVLLPALNPAGLRTKQRRPYHEAEDPNRLWPISRRRLDCADPDCAPPSPLETTYTRLFDLICEWADYLIDFHNMDIGALPFAFRDRIFYRADAGAQGRAAAEALAARQDALLQAYGHTVISDFPPVRYLESRVHRSISAAALLVGRIPSFTAELSTDLLPDPAVVAAAAAGTRNVMRWAGMLDGDPEPIQGVPVIDPGFPVRRIAAPRATEACVVLHRVEAGDRVQVGDVVAEVRDAWGRPKGAGVLRSEYEGFVIRRSLGIYFYPGEPVLRMAVRDDAPRVAPY